MGFCTIHFTNARRDPEATVALNGAKMQEFWPQTWAMQADVLDRIVAYKEGLKQK